MHANARCWLLEAVPARMRPSRDEIKKSGINTTRKWRKESLTAPAERQNNLMCNEAAGEV